MTDDGMSRLCDDLGVELKGEEEVQLIKTEFVMKRFIPRGSVDQRPYFHTEVEDAEADPKHGLRLDSAVWAEMGYPEFITVTVEFGDKFEQEAEYVNPATIEG